MANKKTILSNYPRFFLWRGLFDTFAWVTFAVLFVLLGRKYADVDLLGKISQLIGKDWKFDQYFIGGSFAEKFKLINYAFYFIITIISLNFISLLYNRYLWKKDGYIENNDFYLHNKWIFIINSLIHIACACLLAFSFASSLTTIFALLFIVFNSQDLCPFGGKKLKNLKTERFFSWQSQYIRKIVLYSSLVVLVLPFIIGLLKGFYGKVMATSPTGFAKTFRTLIDTSPTIAKLINILLAPDSTSDVLHWFIFLWFARGVIFDRIGEFGNFWTKINSIGKRVSNYCHYYYYQESWAITNKVLVNLGDYSYLQDAPNFLSGEYLESDLDVNKFYQQNQKVVEYIQFCEIKIKKLTEKNFLHYCLFNEFNAWEDCLRTKELIEKGV